jgi:hypothetical protein
MAHYAFLNKNNVVIEVIVGINENELIEGQEPEEWYSKFRGKKCLRTSYNGNIRKNYAGIGFTYDLERDAFIAPKPFASWILDEDTCTWKAPIDCPDDVSLWNWNEELLDWELQTPSEPED